MGQGGDSLAHSRSEPDRPAGAFLRTSSGIENGRRSWNTVHQVEALALLASMPAPIGPGTAGDPGTRSTRSRPPLCWPACRRRSATRSPRGRAVDRCGRPRAPSARAEILEHVHQVKALASLASMPATIGDTFTTRPRCQSVWTAAGTIGTAGDPGTRSTRSRPSLCWPACRRRSATRSPRGRAVDRCGRPRARPRAPSARPEILEHGPPGQDPRFVGQHAGDDRPGGRGGERFSAGAATAMPKVFFRREFGRGGSRDCRRHVHHGPGLLIGPDGRGHGRRWRRSWNTSTRSRPSLRWPACRRHVHHAAGLSIGVDGRGHGRKSWNTSNRSRPSLRWPACRRHVHHGPGLSIGRGRHRHGRRSWNTVHHVKALASLASMPATRSPRGRAVDRCGRPRAPSARPEILEHGPPRQGPRFAGQHAGDDRQHVYHAAGLSIGVDGRRHVHHAAGLSIGVDGRGHGRGHHRHGRRSWNTVHQVKTLALLASMPAPIGDTFTTRAGCRLVWTAAGTAAGAIGTAGDPGTRPPGQGPRFAGQHAGDTFTTRPGCRSVWMAAGTGGDPGTRPPGRGPRFAGQHAGADRRHVHHAAGLSIGVDGRGRHRHGRRSWNTSTRSRPSLRWPACRRHVHHAAGLSIGVDGRGHGRKSWNTSTGSRPSLCSPRARAVDRCGRPRVPSALAEILEHVHRVEALASLASMPAPIGDTFTTGPGCRSVWTAAGAIGTAGDPGTRPPGRGPRFAGQHAGDGRRHVHHAAGLSIGVDGRGHHRHGRRSWNTVHQVKALALLASMPATIGNTFTTRPGCRSVWTAAGTAAGTIGTAGDPGTRSTRSRPSLCWPACRRRSARGKGGGERFSARRGNRNAQSFLSARIWEGGVP